MEWFFNLVGAVIAWSVISAILKGIWGAITGAFNGNSSGAQVESKGANGSGYNGSFEMRLREERVVQDSNSFIIQRIEVRGRLPISKTTSLLLTSSLLDVTEKDNPQPVTCFIPDFQEAETFAYQDRANLSTASPGAGFRNWVNVLNVIPETLTAGRKGMRKLKLSIQLWDSDKPPQWRLGLALGASPIWSADRTVTWNLPNEGHEESRQNRLRGQEQVIRLAVAVAFADGVMHNAEGDVITAWMKQALAPFNQDARTQRRNELNHAFSTAYSAAESHRLHVDAILDDLKKFTTPQLSEEAVDLCLKVLGADQHMAQVELEMVERIANALGVDRNRYANLRDRQIIATPTTAGGPKDFALLGIDKSWSKDRIRSHLTTEYRKWNSRATVLEDPEERRKAEEMVQLIVEARKALVGE